MAKRLPLQVSGGGRSSARQSWNMADAFAMGRAFGISDLIIAELLPDLELAAMAALRERMGGDG